MAKTRTLAVSAPVLLQETRPVRIEGVVSEIDASERSRRIRVQVRAIEGLGPDQTPRFVRFSVRGDIDYLPGRAIACRAILSPPPRPTVPGDYEFHRDAWFQQLGGVGFVIGACEPLATPPPADAIDRAILWIGAIRRAMATHVAEAAGPKGGGMAAAMISGDRSFISPDDAEALRLSGLTHLLSISGVHMVLVGGAVFFALRFLWPFAEFLALRIPAVHVAAFGAIIACTLYFAVSGAEVATQRAYVMALIAFGAKLFDRPAISLRSLAVAMAIVVVLQPESVVAPGFQMSFAASAALIALYEIWPRLDRPEGAGPIGRVGGWIVGAAATSLVASLATMPFALHHFDRAALFSVLANMAATPIISFWTTPAALAAAVATPFGLDEFFLWLMGHSLALVTDIAHISAEASPPVDLPRLSAAGLGFAAAAIGIFCVLRGAGRFVALAPGIAAAILWTSGPRTVGYVSTDGSVFLKAQAPGDDQTGWTELTAWRAENGLNPLAVQGRPTRDPCGRKALQCRIEAQSGIFEMRNADPSPSPTDSPVAGAAGSVDPPAGGPPNGDPLIRLASCPSQARLVFTPVSGPTAHLAPCDLASAGGASLGIGPDGKVQVTLGRRESGRPWTP